MSGDFEKIDLSLPTSDYAQVVFHNLLETYCPLTDLEVRYTVTPSLVPSPRDWVGVYRVGWRSAREYTTFQYAAVPDEYDGGTKAEVAITFKASSLPKDDGSSFYQFCYVTAAGQVRGASTPFQFRSAASSTGSGASSEDFVEVEDDEDEDILVIKTRTAVLEDTLGKAEREKEELSKTIEYLEKEKESLLEKLISSDKALTQTTDDKAAADAKYTTAQESLDTELQVKQEMALLHDSATRKLAEISEEKASLEKRVDDKDAFILSLQEKIKKLINEKDALTGRNKSLEEEKELLKTHFTTSEDQVRGYTAELDDLRARLRAEEGAAAEMRAAVGALEAELRATRATDEQRQQAASRDQETLSDVTEKLQNTEDKLLAAERCKELLRTEVSALDATFQKLSADLETAKSDTHSYKSQLSKQAELVQSQTDRINSLQAALHTKEQEQRACEEECLGLRQQASEHQQIIHAAKQQRSNEAAEQGSLFALMVAYKDLSERYEKMRSAKDEGRNYLEEAVTKLKRLEQDKQQVEDDCHARLRLGREEYEKRVVECQRLQTELKRALRNGSKSRELERLRRQSSTASSIKTSETGSASQSEASPGSPAPQTSQSEASPAPQPSQLEASPDPQPSQSEASAPQESADNLSLMEMTAAEMQTQLADLGEELENRRAKKQKYKEMYQAEKEKRAYQQQHHFSQLQDKDAEIQRLSHQLQDAEQDFQQRVATFEALLEEQKHEMLRERAARPNEANVHYPPQQPPYPMPPFMAPAMAQQPFYPPQIPQMGLPPPIFPPGPIHHNPLPTNVACQAPPIMTCQAPPIMTCQAPPIMTCQAPPIMTCQAPPTMTSQAPIMSQAPPTIPPRTHFQERTVILVNPAALTPEPTTLDPALTELDPLNDSPIEGAPDSPLPPPMTPEKSPQAKVAEVKAAIGEVKDTHIDMGEEDEEERFHDAVEDPVTPSAPQQADELAARQELLHSLLIGERMCPICEMKFPETTLEKDLHRHVEAHMGQTCPMCSKTFDEDAPQGVYMDHVQSHFND